jgi:nucleoside 2-deoxyribosyltransferase
MTDRYRVYLAADLFSAFERGRNLRLAAELDRRGVEVFLPQTIEAPDVGGSIDLEPVYRRCREALLDVDLVLALLDGASVDAGTAWEVGYAVAHDVTVLGVRTDLRKAESAGVNIMLEFSVTRMVYLTGYRKAESLVINAICEAVDEMRTTGPCGSHKERRN